MTGCGSVKPPGYDGRNRIGQLRHLRTFAIRNGEVAPYLGFAKGKDAPGEEIAGRIFHIYSWRRLNHSSVINRASPAEGLHHGA